LISRYATWLMGRYLDYSTAKAETRLGWSPEPSYPETISRTVRWYLDQRTQTSTSAAIQPV
jgi:nucleoside-diphosphate-sugar epimerase